MSTGTKSVDQYFNDHIKEWAKSPNIVGASTELIDKENPTLGKAIHLIVDNTQNPSVLKIQSSIKNDKYEVVLSQIVEPVSKHMVTTRSQQKADGMSIEKIGLNWNTPLNSSSKDSSLGAVIANGEDWYIMTCGHFRNTGESVYIGSNSNDSIGSVTKKVLSSSSDVSIIKIKDKKKFSPPSSIYNDRALSTTIADPIEYKICYFSGAYTKEFIFGSIDSINTYVKMEDGSEVYNAIIARFGITKTVIGDSGCGLMMLNEDLASVSLVGILVAGGTDTRGSFDIFLPIRKCYEDVGFNSKDNKLVLS